MRVRVYVDGFNLYYGGKRLAARHAGGKVPQWKWLDLRALALRIVEQRWMGRDAVVDHVTYCTARVVGDPDNHARQAAYLRALEVSGTVDRIEFGLFKERYRELPRATRGPDGGPVLAGRRLQMVGVSIREEKGSDVNLASHLLTDALTGAMDAAVVISNDSDLEFPVREVRARMPVGTVSPYGPVHGSLRPVMTPGCGHWFHQLDLAQLAACQLPDEVAGIKRPRKW